MNAKRFRSSLEEEEGLFSVNIHRPFPAMVSPDIQTQRQRLPSRIAHGFLGGKVFISDGLVTFVCKSRLGLPLHNPVHAWVLDM